MSSARGGRNCEQRPQLTLDHIYDRRLGRQAARHSVLALPADLGLRVDRFVIDALTGDSLQHLLG